MILVTGATGNVGREVVEQFLGRGEAVRVFTRDGGKVAGWGDRVQVATGDLRDPASLGRALAGVEAAFLMNGGSDPATFGRAIEAARGQGRPRVVFLSICWASPALRAQLPQLEIGAWHQAMEEAITRAGFPTSFVRPSAFMTNAYGWSGSIKAEGLVSNPMGEGRTAPIASPDIARVVVEALTNPALAGEAFELTGGELLSVPEQVAILARVVGKPIRCVEIPAEAAAQGMIRGGVPAPVAAAVAQSFAAVRAGQAAVLTDTVARVTGQPPLGFEAWARQNAARFS